MVSALENASADTKALPRVTIIAIVLIVILAALVFLLAVGCCLCRSGRRHRSRHRKHTKVRYGAKGWCVSGSAPLGL